MTRYNDAAAEQPTLVDAELTPAEVVELWSFLHGDIMEAGIRQQLRTSLGLCPRHTWGYAAAEIELWQTGAGARGGHQPFDVSILYEDLLDHVAARMSRPAGLFHHDLRRALTPRADCCICALLKPGRMSGREPTPIGYGGATAADLASETNQLTYTTAWCRQTWPQWRGRVCPRCAAAFHGGADELPESNDRLCARLCRLHLLRNAVSVNCAHTAAGSLQAIAGRLGRLSRSMTKDGAASTAEDDSSWIEALGWFAGWRVPLAIAAAIG